MFCIACSYLGQPSKHGLQAHNAAHTPPLCSRWRSDSTCAPTRRPSATRTSRSSLPRTFSRTPILYYHVTVKHTPLLALPALLGGLPRGRAPPTAPKRARAARWQRFSGRRKRMVTRSRTFFRPPPPPPPVPRLCTGTSALRRSQDGGPRLLHTPTSPRMVTAASTRATTETKASTPTTTARARLWQRQRRRTPTRRSSTT